MIGDVDPLLRAVVESVEQRCASVRLHYGRRLIVGLAGSVSVGKTTFANALANELGTGFGRAVTVVGTDGFLLPNAVLEPQGRMYFKGFPDTYDAHALQTFLTTAGSSATNALVPVYSHEVFDTVGSQVVDLPEIVVIEGVNVLGNAYNDLLDLSIYLDATEDVVIDWFVQRFVGLIREAESDASSFYVRFVALDPHERLATAREVWDSINGPNLHNHIHPTAANADLIVHLGADHKVHSVKVQSQRL
jgi:type I pantothenate kinase